MMNRETAAANAIGIIDRPGNKKLIEHFESNGKKVFTFPPIEPHETELGETEQDSLKAFADYDWIVFTDVFTVDAFFDLLEEQNADLFELDDLRICSLGEAVADRLRFRQIHSDVIPARADSPAVFAAITDYIYDLDDFTGLKFLILGGVCPDARLGELLAEKGAQVIEIEIYRLEKNDLFAETKMRTLIYGGAVDEFLFNSPEDVLSVCRLTGRDDFSTVISNSEVRALNEITRQMLFELGIKSEM